MDHELRAHLVDILPSGVSLTAIFDSSNVLDLDLLDLDHYLCNNVYIPSMTEDEPHPVGLNLPTRYFPRPSSIRMESAYRPDDNMDAVSTVPAPPIRVYMRKEHPNPGEVGSQRRYARVYQTKSRSEDDGAVMDWHQSARAPRYSEPLQHSSDLENFRSCAPTSVHIPRCDSPASMTYRGWRELVTSNVVSTKLVALVSNQGRTYLSMFDLLPPPPPFPTDLALRSFKPHKQPQFWTGTLSHHGM